MNRPDGGVRRARDRRAAGFLLRSFCSAAETSYAKQNNDVLDTSLPTLLAPVREDKESEVFGRSKEPSRRFQDR